MIVFDFDKTLTYRDTTLSFFLFGLTPVGSMYCFTMFCVLVVMVKLKFIDVHRLKQAMINWRFKGSSLQAWENHCKDFATCIKTNALFRQVNWAEPSLVVASASFKEVLLHLFPSSVIVIGSEVSCLQGIRIIKHAMGEEKAMLIRAAGIESFDRLYTDSISDLPLMKMAAEVIWVNGDQQTFLARDTIKKWVNKK
jgi:hypothetical protein